MLEGYPCYYTCLIKNFLPPLCYCRIFEIIVSFVYVCLCLPARNFTLSFPMCWCLGVKVVYPPFVFHQKKKQTITQAKVSIYKDAKPVQQESEFSTLTHCAWDTPISCKTPACTLHVFILMHIVIIIIRDKTWIVRSRDQGLIDSFQFCH